MHSSDLLKQYAAYNLWANIRMVEWLQCHPEKKMTTPTPSSFPTLRETMLHIWSAQDIWLRRLKGESPETTLSETFRGSHAALIAGLLSSSHDFKNYLAPKSKIYFSKSTIYYHTNGTLYEQNNAEIILHCLQHSTFHRGQVLTMAHCLKIDNPPKTDYIEFVRQRKPKVV